MFLIILVVIISVFLYTVIIKKSADKVYRFVLISYLGYAMLSIILSIINPYGYYIVSTETYLLMIASVISFIIGVIFYYRGGRSHQDSEVPITSSFDKLISSKLVIFIYLSAFVYCLPFVKNAIVLAAASGGYQMEDKLEVVFGNSWVANMVYAFILYPLLHIDLALISIIIIKRSRKTFATVILSLYFIEFTLIAGGRSLFMIAVLYFLVIYVCLSKSEKLSSLFKFKTCLISIMVALGVMFGMSLMTNYRSNGQLFSGLVDGGLSEGFSDTSEKIVSYSILGISMFDQARTNGTIEAFSHKYGRASFAGLDSWIAIVAHNIGIKYNPTTDIVTYAQDNIIPIGPNHQYNYAYTGNFYHYIDFGWVGVIFFPFLFGYFMSKIIMAFKKNSSFPNLLMLALAYYIMMHSLFTCYFIKQWVFVYISLLWYLNKKLYSKC